MRAALVVALAVVVIAVVVAHPPHSLLASPFAPDSTAASDVPAALPGAFGESRAVRIQLRMPGELFEFPLDVPPASAPIRYQWVTAEDSAVVSPSVRAIGTTVAAPPRPGFYRLVVQRGDTSTIVDSIVVGVMVPFSAKFGSTLNGYRIGTYQWERAHGDATPPPRGFVEVRAADAELPVSTHLRLADFLTHDGQETWPRYVALDPRILDKVELVLEYLGSRDHAMPMSVNSGFRTPLHNVRVPRAASDSRHQYGDAVDLALDADGDGKVTYQDALSVAHAVEEVERLHPDLVGGMGIYGNRGTVPYVHIDVRGTRKRWRE